MPQPNPVRWFEIYVQDMARARRFYETVLDTKLERLDSGGVEMWAFPSAQDKYGVGGTLVKVDGVRSGGNSTLVYFGCEDCSIEAGRIAGCRRYGPARARCRSGSTVMSCSRSTPKAT